MDTIGGPVVTQHGSQRAGGAAALYLAVALLGAIPYFLLVVDYPGATTAAARLTLVVDHYPSMYAMYFGTYVAFGLAIAVLALALQARLGAAAPFVMRVATVVGLLWSFALVASGSVFLHGMTTVVDLAGTDRAAAVLAWQAIEPVALALGGAGGELLGGLWVLLVSLVALRGRGLHPVLGWFGAGVGVLGLVSVVPALHDAAVTFGMLEIVWFTGLGIVLLRTPTPPDVRDPVAPSGALRHEGVTP